MISHHSLSMMWKVTRNRVQSHMSRKMELNDKNFLSTKPSRLIITGKSFRWRTVKEWNSLSADIRETPGCLDHHSEDRLETRY